jgi:hypothetical protein
MSDLNGIVPVGNIVDDNMSATVSKIVRPLVIDLTKDDDEPVQGQTPLPSFFDLFSGNNATTSQAPLCLLTPSQASWPEIPAFGERQDAHLFRFELGVPTREPNDGSKVTTVGYERIGTLTDC